jgi:hypothetical protein
MLPLACVLLTNITCIAIARMTVRRRARMSIAVRGSIVGRSVAVGPACYGRCRVMLSSMRENERTVLTDNNGGFGFGNLP